jgi:hypothetical protein
VRNADLDLCYGGLKLRRRTRRGAAYRFEIRILEVYLHNGEGKVEVLQRKSESVVRFIDSGVISEWAVTEQT